MNLTLTFHLLFLSGSNDPDDMIVRAFRAYEGTGDKARTIEASMFQHALKTWGDKFSQSEIDDIFGEFEADDDGFIAAKDIIGLFVAGGGEPKEEAPVEEAAPAAAAADDGGEPAEGGKKKKKKKKAKA
jgi:hypothetical protein